MKHKPITPYDHPRRRRIANRAAWDKLPVGTLLKYSDACALVKCDGERVQIIRITGEYLPWDSATAYSYEAVVLPAGERLEGILRG